MGAGAAVTARRQSRMLNIVLCISAALGLILSVYDVYILFKKDLDKDYLAYCDIDELFSCSKVFSSKYGKGFGLIGPYFGEDHFLNQPNGAYGILLYSILLALSLVRGTWAAKLQLALIICTNCFTPYLAYLLKVIQAVCVVCVATYIVNAILLVVAFYRLSYLESSSSRRRKNNNKKKSNKKD